jgi:hypothetical protein
MTSEEQQLSTTTGSSARRQWADLGSSEERLHRHLTPKTGTEQGTEQGKREESEKAANEAVKERRMQQPQHHSLSLSHIPPCLFSTDVSVTCGALSSRSSSLSVGGSSWLYTDQHTDKTERINTPTTNRSTSLTRPSSTVRLTFLW